MAQAQIETVDVTIEVPADMLEKLQRAAGSGPLVYDFDMDEAGVILMTPARRQPNSSPDR